MMRGGFLRRTARQSTLLTTGHRVPRYFLTIAYDGGAYAGWQRQKDQDTVQQRLEAAVASIFGVHCHVHGAGRTDAGVHALRQVAHVDLPRPFDANQLPRALSSQLPPDIGVREARRVPDELHARFSAIGKRYLYRCRNQRDAPVHGRGYVAWVPGPLDLQEMRRGAAQLVGRHDFAAFSSNPGYPRDRGTVRTIQGLHLIRRRGGFDLAVQGDGFLYNMVRTIAGTLLWVGKGKLRPDDVGAILRSGDRRRAGPNAPASGLFMLRVLYPKPAAEGSIRYNPE